MFRYRLVDVFWTHLGEFEATVPYWSVGQEFFASGGQRYVIREIHPSLTPGSEYTATWLVERAK